MNRETAQAGFTVRLAGKLIAGWIIPRFGGSDTILAHATRRYDVGLDWKALRAGTRLPASLYASWPAMFTRPPGLWLGELSCGELVLR